MNKNSESNVISLNDTGINRPQQNGNNKNINKQRAPQPETFKDRMNRARASMQLALNVDKPTYDQVESNYKEQGMAQDILDKPAWKKKGTSRKVLYELGRRYYTDTMKTMNKSTQFELLNAEMLLLDDFELGAFVGELAKKIPFVGSIPGIDEAASKITSYGIDKLKGAWNRIFGENGPSDGTDSLYFQADAIDIDFLVTALCPGVFNDRLGRITDSSQGRTSTYHYKSEFQVFTNNLGNYGFYCMPDNAHFAGPPNAQSAFIVYKNGNNFLPTIGSGTQILFEGPLATSAFNFMSCRTVGASLRFIPSTSLLNLSGSIEQATFADEPNASFQAASINWAIPQNELPQMTAYTVGSLKSEDFTPHSIIATPMDYWDQPLLSIIGPAEVNNFDPAQGQQVLITGAPASVYIGTMIVDISGEGRPVSSILGQVYTSAPNFGPMTADAIALGLKHYGLSSMTLRAREKLAKEIIADNPKNLKEFMDLLARVVSK